MTISILPVSLVGGALVLAGLCMVFRNRLAELGFAAERALNGLKHKTIEADGETWRYLEGGETSAEAILMLHGFTANKDNWTRIVGRLTKRYRVIAPDLPGFGESARHPAWSYALPAQRERLRAFVRALGLQRFHIVGSSMGGHLAALYTHAYPDQIITLGLFDNAGITAPRESEMFAALARGENLLLTNSVKDFDRVLEFVAHKKLFVPWPAKRYLAEHAAADRDFNAYIFSQYEQDLTEGLEKILPRIKKPVLILWGRLDRILDVSSIDVMRPLLPQAEVAIMEKTGHLPMFERPAETAAHYLAFIGRHR